MTSLGLFFICQTLANSVNASFVQVESSCSHARQSTSVQQLRPSTSCDRVPMEDVRPSRRHQGSGRRGSRSAKTLDPRHRCRVSPTSTMVSKTFSSSSSSSFSSLRTVRSSTNLHHRAGILNLLSFAFNCVLQQRCF